MLPHSLLQSSSSQKTNVRETTKSPTSQKRKKQVAHSVPCQLEYSGESLSPFTYKCHLPSSQGLGKVLLSPPWCAWQTPLPCPGDKLVMHSEKVRGNSMHFAPGAFSLSSFSFTPHWYAVICVSRLEYIGFVSISLKDEALWCLIRRSGCWSSNYWGGLMIGFFDGGALLW